MRQREREREKEKEREREREREREKEKERVTGRVVAIERLLPVFNKASIALIKFS